MWIYDITRLHIPDTLYKYFSLTDDSFLNELKFNSLSEEKVFLANSKDFNDPFDNKAFFYRNERLNCFQELKRFDGHFCDEIMYNSRSTSFTKVGYNSMPMWAYYSNNHLGFCVAYDMKEPLNLQFSASTMPIQYINQRIDITDLLIDQIDMLLKEKNRQIKEGRKTIIKDDLLLIYTIVFLQNIKHSMWQHEEEFRCSASRTSVGMPYIMAVPSAIYAGVKCTSSNMGKLCDVCHMLNIPFFHMKFNEFNRDFQMEAERII